MEAVFILATFLVALVTAIVEMVKITFPNLKKNYIPVVALVIGVAIASVATPFTDLSMEFRLWAGAFAGLASTGLFELVFNPRPGVAKDK